MPIKQITQQISLDKFEFEINPSLKGFLIQSLFPMTDKIDSYMLCSELDLQSGYEMQSTISFGKALEHQKISQQTLVSLNNQQVNPHATTSTHRVSLMQIFEEYLKDPLSTYTLELSFSKQIPCCRASKTVNQKYGKYTTSIGQSEFYHSLQIQHTEVDTPYQPTAKPKLTKISQILKMIQRNKKQKIVQNPTENNLPLKKQTTCHEIKIQDMELVDLDKKPQQLEKQAQRPESQAFLGLESNVSNHCQSIAEKLTFKNAKSQKKPIQKEPLSPVPQNPERKILKIQNLNVKTASHQNNHKGLISGLEFSKKLRKKTFTHKSPDQNIKVKPFEVSY